MSEVWFMAHQTAWVLGWILIVLIAAAAYLMIGLKMTRDPALIMVWPFIALARGVVWLVRSVARVLVTLFCFAVRMTDDADAAPVVKAGKAGKAPPPRPADPPRARVDPYRSEEDKDLAELESVESQINRLEVRKRDLIIRIEARKTPRSKLVREDPKLRN